MPLDLKNVGSTYQRMVTRMFKSQIGRNVEVYINDMVVKKRQVVEQAGCRALSRFGGGVLGVEGT